MPYIQLPDGNSYEIPEGMSYDEGISKAQKEFPGSFPAPKVGALKSGLAGAAVGLGGLPLGMAHAGAKLLGIEDTGVQSARESLKEWGKQHGTESFAGRVGETIGGLAPFALAAPFTGGMSLAAELGLNAVTMGAPGAVDAYEEAKKSGAGDAEAYSKAALAAGMGTVAPKIVSGGSQAVGKALKVGESVLPQAALASGEGAVFTGAQQLANKAIEQAAGRDTGTPWLSPEDIASSALGFGVVRGAHKMLAPKKPAAVKPPPAKEAPPAPEVDTTTPEYKLDLGQRYDAAEATFEELKKQAAALAKPTTEVGKLQYAEAQQAIKDHLNDVLKPLAKEYLPVQAEVAQLRAQQARGEAPAAEVPAAPTDLFGNPVEPTVEAAAPEAPVDYHRQAMLLQQHVDTLQDQVAKATEPQQIVALAKQHADAEKALAAAKEQAGKQPKPLDMQLADATKQLAKAQEEGDVTKAGKLAQKVLTLKEQGAQENVIPLEKFKPTVTIPDQSLRALQLQTAPEAKAANEAARVRAGAMEGEEGEPAIVQQAQADKAAADAAAAKAAQDAETARIQRNLSAQQAPLFEAPMGTTARSASLQATADYAEQLRATVRDARTKMAAARATGNDAAIAEARKIADDAIEKLRDLSAPTPTAPIGSEGGLKLQQRIDYATPRAEAAAPAERVPDLTSLRAQIDSLPENIHPAQQALVDRLQEKLPAVAASPERAQMAADWLYRLSLGPQVQARGEAAREATGFREKDIAQMLRGLEPRPGADTLRAPVEGPVTPRGWEPPAPEQRVIAAQGEAAHKEGEAAANAMRIAEQAAMERKAALPGRKVIAEQRRQWVAELAAKQEEINRYRAAADSKTVSEDMGITQASAVTMRDTAIREANELRSRLERSAEAEKIEAKIAVLESSEKGGINEPGLKKRTLNSRIKALEKARADLVEVYKTPPKKGGYKVEEIKPAGAREEVPLEEEAARIAEATDKAQEELEKAQHAGDERRIAYYKQQLRILETGRLPERLIGPLVKPIVHAGNVRTGTAESKAGEMKTGVRGTEQGGAKRGVTATQAIREANKVAAGEEGLKAELRAEQDAERIAEERRKEEAAKDAAAVAEARKAKPATRKTVGNKERKLTAAEKEAVQAELDAEYAAEMRKEDARAASNPDQDRATTDLTDTGREAAEDGRILDLLDDVAKNGATPERRAQAEALKKLVMRSKLEVTDNLMHEGKRVAGLYDPAKNTIYLDREALSQEDFIHEAYHAATDRVLLADKDALTPTQRAARAELERMHTALKNNPNFEGLHATKTVREFVAEVKTNDALRAKMQEIGKPTTLWTRFKDAIKRLLGIGPKDMSPAAADRLIEDILQPSRVIEKTAEAPSLFRKKESTLPTELTEFSKYVHDERTALDKAKEMKDSAGLAFRQAVADMRASLREALTYGDKVRGSALEGLLSQKDSNINNVQNVAEFGSLGVSKDANGNVVVTAGNSASLKDVFEQATNLPGADGKEKIDLYQRYRIARRAEQVGWDKMDFSDPAGARAAGRKLLDAVAADPKLKAAFDAVDKPYDSLNKGLVKFLEQTHALPKDVIDKMMADKDYVPYYRVNGDTVEALLPDGKFRSIGDIRTQPFLKELVGGEQKFMNFNDSVMRNISLLSSIGMDNLTAKEISYHLQDAAKGTGKMVIQRGKGPASQDIVRFRQKPDPSVKDDDGWRHIKIDTEGTVLSGIPTTLLAQSMAGSYSALSGLEKAGAWAGSYLRSGITRNPLYIVRQLIKDPMHASVTGNLQATPIAAVIKSMRNFAEIVSGNSREAEILRKHGVLHSNIFSGTHDDYQKIGRMLAGDQQGWWDRVKAATDKYAMAADAATRVQVYKDIIAKGGSESEATHAARELMNFNRRGSAQSVQFLGHVIPFFNSQIQGLDLLYRSASGKMPAQERMATKQKFFNRAMAMSAMAFTYAALMEDDPQWAGQSLYQKMANIAIPNIFSEEGEALKIPAPFESGMLFYSLPVAIMQAMKQDFSREDYKTVASILTNQLPGGSVIPMPSALKGAVEVMTNYSMTTGLPIESAAMKKLDPAQRYNEHTTELAKAFGRMLSEAKVPLSPMQIEHLSNAYMGTLPTAVAGLVDTLFEDSAVEKPTKHLGEYPFLRQLFMPAIGSDASSHAYEKASESEMVRSTFKHFVDMGQVEEAKQYRESHKAEFAAATAAGAYVKQMGMLKKDIERIRNLPKSAMNADEKQARIDKLKQAQQARANQFLEAYRRIEQNVGQGGA